MRAGSSVALAVGLAIALGVGLFVALHMSQGTILDCARARGACEVRRVLGPGVETSRTSIPIAKIERALLAATRDSEGEHLEAIALFHDGELDVLDGYSNVGGDAKRAWVAEVNTFLRDARAPSLLIEGGHPNAFWGWTALTILVAVFVLTTRTRIVVDYDAERLALQSNLLLPAKVYALASVERVALESEEDDGTTITTPMLIFRDGTKLALRIPSNIESRLKKKLVEDLSAALAERS